MHRRTLLKVLAAQAVPAVSPGQGKFRVAMPGCRRVSQEYAEVYRVLPDAENRRDCGVESGNAGRSPASDTAPRPSPGRHAMLKEVVPDIAAVVTPARFYIAAVIACGEAGVKGIST